MGCSELGIDIATSEQVGGDKGDDGIEWVDGGNTAAFIMRIK